MPTFYHIHRGTNDANLNKNFIDGKLLYFSKKNSLWHNMERDIGCAQYGGYVEYKIVIPSSYYTTSFKPTSSNKIVKLTKDNMKTMYKHSISGKLF